MGPQAERPRFPDPLLRRTLGPDPSSKATLWLKAQHKGAPPETTAPLVQPTESAARITADEAIAIALKDAKLTKDQVRDLDVELDRDDGVLHYDVDFEKDRNDYDYEIDAATGKILRSEIEHD